MNIVFGGSFNPPTWGHIRIIEKLHETFLPTKIIIIPVGSSYPKNDLVAFKHRFEMAKIAFFSLPYCEVSDIEEQSKFTGTISTLKRLSNTYQDIWYVIGADQLLTIDDWIESSLLMASFGFIVMDRDHVLKEEIRIKYQNKIKKIIFLDFNHAGKSSLFRNNPNRYQHFIKEEVLTYIKENHLYLRGDDHVL